jgi:microcystin-dependent protein
MLWYGSSAPTGWLICNGQNGTPDLRGRFPVGVGSGDYTLGKTGGEEKHTLTPVEMPTHTHVVTDPGHTHYLNFNSQNPSGGTGHAGPREQNPNATAFTVRRATTGISINNTGGGQAHENRPPYFALNFIMKI